MPAGIAALIAPIRTYIFIGCIFDGINLPREIYLIGRYIAHQPAERD